MLHAFTVQDIGVQLSNFVKAIMETHAECRDIVSGANGSFPIDIDLEQVCYKNYIMLAIVYSYLIDYNHNRNNFNTITLFIGDPFNENRISDFKLFVEMFY